MAYQRVQIKGFPGYEIDTDGEVYSFWRRGKISADSVKLKGSISKLGKGYRQVTLKKGAKNFNYRIHRLLAQVFLTQPSDKKIVCHKDGNRFNNTLSNLYWGTDQENANDRVKHGRHLNVPRGEQNHYAKLTEGEVRVIKRACLIGIKQVRIAELIGITVQTVCDIKKGRSWKHITLSP